MNEPLNTEQAMRYSRQILLAGFDLDKQEMLCASKVLMIGAGGLGCAAAQYLVAAGIGQLTIIDDDTIETTNLQRQVLHFEERIGEKKVDSALKTLSSINSKVALFGIDKRQDKAELEALMHLHDIVIDCSDNLATRNLLNAVCHITNTPLVSGAAIRMEGQIFCVIPKNNTACYGCISHFIGEQNLSCVESGVMSPIVGIVGATQALEAIKILSKYGELAVNKLQVYDAMQSRWESFSVDVLPNCKVCAD